MNDANPFATRYVRPGAIDFLFPADASLPQLVSRLEGTGWRGEIIGPHGSGKSTLLQALIPELTRRGAHVSLFTLRDGARSLPPQNSDDVSWFPPSHQQKDEKPLRKIWIVDGAEQLSCFNLWRLKMIQWWKKQGLILTSHRSLGLPTLIQTTVSPATAWNVVQRLLRDGEPIIQRADVEAALQAHGGNLREALMALFDLYQRRQRSAVR